MNTNDGGPAFPRYGTDYCERQSGMTLRDWFAGKALAAIPHIGCGCDLRVEEVALAAYQLADAMLKAREVQS